jgi:hypothetical protein
LAGQRSDQRNQGQAPAGGIAWNPAEDGVLGYVLLIVAFFAITGIFRLFGIIE